MLKNVERKNAPDQAWHVCPFTGLPVEITEVRVNGPKGISIQYQCLTRIDACRPEVCPLFPKEGQVVPKAGPYELPYRSDRGICSILLSALGGDGANTAAKLLFEVAVNRMGLDGGLDAKYGSEKKEAENKVLKAEGEKQKAITIGISFGLLLVAILAFFIFRGYRQKHKANELLAARNIEINENKILHI